jgi:hypothetical protein
MKKQTKWLLCAGLLCIASHYFLPLIHIPEFIVEFIRGLGIGLIISIPFVKRKLEKKLVI